MSVVAVENHGGIAVVRVDNPPVNALSHALRSGLIEAAEKIDADDSIRAAVLICAGRTFIAGADIREFNAAPKEPHLPDTINRIEASSKPWVAAIHGTALGGGLEVALGCHYRVAVSTARAGLPEVNLGLIPGAGGTIRLPRAANPEFALEMITSGKPAGAGAAHDAGLIDAIVPEGQDLETFALSFAADASAKPLPEPLSTRQPATAPTAGWWEQAIGNIEKKAKGQLSPVTAARIVRNGFEKPFAEALADERSAFLELKDGDQSKAMRHAFFAEREMGKVPFVEGAQTRDIHRVAVIGGGTMGAGIAAAALLNGCAVDMIEREEGPAEAGYHRVMGILDSSLKRGLISADKREALENAFTATAGYAKTADADLVIEAVFEDMDVKKAVFAQLGEVTRPECILATNTSYLDINEIAKSVGNPARVVGLHFFSPAHIMKLVEVIRTGSVSPETYGTAFAFAKRLKKNPVYSGVCDGFIGNRILYEYRKVCDFMLEDGCLPQQIDAAMREFGMAMGPFAMGDMAGLDIGWAARKRRAATRDPNERYSRIADRICELGRFGQKTGAGWYDYSGEARGGTPDPLIEKIILEESEKNGIVRREFTSREIQDTVVSTMAAEGQKILEEGIALRASDIDMVLILGYGFPRWRGGPMFMTSNAG